MDAESDYENKRARDAIQIQTIETIQSMIDVSADRLEGLRTQCSTSAELTQQEIRTLEGKLVKHFSRQLVIKASLGDEMKRQLRDVPCLAQWLRVVGLSPESIEAVCSRVPSLEALRERSDHEMRALLVGARDEEVLRLQRAMHRLRTYIEALGRGESGEGSELQLFWDSWERHARASPRSRPKPNKHNDEHNNTNHKKGSGVRSPSGGAGASRLAAGAPLTKSRSHESQLSRPDASDLSDNSQSSAVNTTEGTTPPASPREPEPDNTPTHTHPPSHNYNNNVWSNMSGVPRSPRTPRTPVTRCMAHDIAHRFTKTFNMIATCDYCDKQMLFGSGLKCKECKFKCHRDCESKVPPSCGLPPEFVAAFKDKFHKDGGYYGCVSPVSARGSVSTGSGVGAGAGGFLAAFTHRPRRRHHAPLHNTLTNNGVSGGAGGPDSSSNTSSCNSSTPSSPALCAPAPHPAPHPAHPSHLTHKQQFQFPEVRPAVSSPNHTSSIQSPARSHHENKDDLVNSLNSDPRRNAVEARARENQDARWPRQNSGCTGRLTCEWRGTEKREREEFPLACQLPPRVPVTTKELSMKEWDIPYDELKLFEVIGTGRFGTVYRGSWHGAVAVKLLHVSNLADDCVPLDTFKHEVATFRKTRHENLVLFMGACMKPPRLAIVTSLCKGMTLYTHIHLRKDKFTANKSVIVAQQISQGMGYLHARGIIHKDLKTKNIFLENGKVVITDFGLFSVTKLCFGNKELGSGSRLGLPGGWLCYLAPELIRALTPHASLHLPFSKATDVYAFGTVWYELLLGEYPFKGQPPESIIWQVGKGVKQSLANMQASRDIKDILMACWSFRSSDRPDFPRLLTTLQKLPRKRLARSPSHPVHLSRSADSVF